MARIFEVNTSDYIPEEGTPGMQTKRRIINHGLMHIDLCSELESNYNAKIVSETDDPFQTTLEISSLSSNVKITSGDSDDSDYTIRYEVNGPGESIDEIKKTLEEKLNIKLSEVI